MEGSFGSIAEKISRARKEVEAEIEKSKKSLIKSLRSEKNGLIEGIERREEELLKRVEKLQERELLKSRLTIYGLILLLGLLLGSAAGAAAASSWISRKNIVLPANEWSYGSDQKREWFIRERR